MSESDLSKWTKALLIKIHVITGWVIPEDEGYMSILLDQFRKKLTESYVNVNADEIEYAFRTYGTTVKDWGKSMNLSLIDEVMIPYLEVRQSVSRLEETKEQPLIEHKEDLSELAMQEWYEETVKQLKSGKITLEFLPFMLAQWMINKGEIAVTETYKMEAGFRIGKALYDQPEKRDEYRIFRKMVTDGELSGRYVKQIDELAARMALSDYILK